MNKLRFRPMEQGDIDHIARWINDEQVFKHLYMLWHPMPAEALRAWYEQERAASAHMFVFFAGEGGREPAGMGLVHYIHEKNRCAELSLIINPAFFNQGLGTHILAMLTRYSFDVLNLHKIFVHCVEYNRKMISILAKTGFVREGVFRKELFFSGQYHDIYRYGCLQSEYYDKSHSEKSGKKTHNTT